MKYLLDTNIVSYFLRNASEQLSRRILDSSPDSLGISIISAGELHFGLSKLPPSKRATELAHHLGVILSAIPVLPLPTSAATYYGRVRAHLESAGTPIGNNDVWIAAHALATNMALVTNNTREFVRVPGLRVDNWL